MLTVIFLYDIILIKHIITNVYKYICYKINRKGGFICIKKQIS